MLITSVVCCVLMTFRKLIYSLPHGGCNEPNVFQFGNISKHRCLTLGWNSSYGFKSAPFQVEKKQIDADVQSNMHENEQYELVSRFIALRHRDCMKVIEEVTAAGPYVSLYKNTKAFPSIINVITCPLT